MPIQVKPADTILFTGDSITDGGRREPATAPLGAGYVRMIADALTESTDDLTIVNTGVGGNRAVDLESRWQFDVLDHRPDLLTIMIGINDTWRRYTDGTPTPAETFGDHYRDILTRSRAKLSGPIVLFEPFLVEVTDAQRSWREDLDPKIDVVRAAAQEFEAELIPTDALMSAAAREFGATSVTTDGVHPTEAGHRVLADAWLAVVGR
jgi:lysophospholipase L1-like esterase